MFRGVPTHEQIVGIVLVVAVGLVPVVAAPPGISQQGSAYSGTFVSFDTSGDAVTDYAVNGRTVIQSVSVQSESKAASRDGIDLGADLSVVTNFAGAAVSVSSTSSTQATVTSDSGAKLRAHDNDRGILVVTADGESQLVRANISASSEAEQAAGNRVVVTQEDGNQGTFIATGGGEVTVNEDGNVSARVNNGVLVYRQYEGERTDSEDQQERMIADGTAAAEVYVQQSSEGGQEVATDVVAYSEDTTVDVTERSRNRVDLTVDRAQSEGRVVITSLSEEAFESTDNIRVAVDGNATVEASSYSEIRQATKGGAQSKYLVRQSSGARASSDVVVGINEFSSRDVSVTSADDDGTEGADGDAPGFGVGVALIALVTAGLLARYRR